MIKKIIERFGKLNILVNNAGIAPPERKDVLKASEASFDRVISVNLKGPYFLTQLVANKMVEAKQKDPDFEAGIINITSVSAELPSRNRGDYCISKAGLSMTTKLWASRLGEFDIPVYEIRPGIIETDMTAGVKDKYDELIQNGLLVNKRWGTPEDIGKATAAIVEGSFSYSTGLIINADGGLTLQSL
jgi:NAD(P)-dependent dehydrogenase (short-subunit alcohol dehydrogenase family)